MFPGQKVAVLIEGDFWHGNAWRVRGLSSLAALFPTRTEWRVAKITRNMQRDAEVTRALTEQGWIVLRFWESEVQQNADSVAEWVAEQVRERR